MNYNIYLDESGNTGDIKIKDGKWNWGNQLYFALGSFCIEEKKEKEFYYSVKNILDSFEAGLGVTKELKARSKYTFKYELLAKIIKILEEYNAKVYIDISNKKYKVIMTIVEYCIYPYYLEENFLSDRDRKINAANRLYNINDNIINKFIEICYFKGSEEDKHREFLQFLKELNNLISEKNINIGINKVIKFIEKYKENNLTIRNIFPIVDFNNKGSETCFLPNLDAYLNIIASISSLTLRQNDKLYIYHDEQAQFSSQIQKWTNDIKKQNLLNNINSIEFKKSKEDILIQVADFITGITLQIFNLITTSRFLNRKDKEVINLSKPLLQCCNIICPRYEQEKFGRACNFKMKKTRVPII